MNLEDNIGDVVRKARMMSSVSLEAAARAAKISESDLRTLEDSGQTSAVPDYRALASVLGLNGRALAAVAAGWVPGEKNLGLWREFRCITNDDGGMAVNSYLVWDEATREAALFDTGWNIRTVLDLVRTNELQVRHVFITHSHEDHIAALEQVRKEFPKARFHSSMSNAPLNERNRPNEFVHLGSLRITNRATPGHAEDGTTYIIGNWPEDAPHVAIVGDAIFAGSMGRGNISWDQARQKVHEEILTLPPETLLCPGHGPLTTVAEEKLNNPFFAK